MAAARPWAAAHSGIRFVTPSQRHDGREAAILAHRHRVYLEARARRPGRWTRHTRTGHPSRRFASTPDTASRRETIDHLSRGNSLDTHRDGSSEIYYYDHDNRRILTVTRLPDGTVDKVRLVFGKLEVEYDGDGSVTKTVAHLALDCPLGRVVNRGAEHRVIHGQLV